MPLNAGKPRLLPAKAKYLKVMAAYQPGITELALAARTPVLEKATHTFEWIYDAYNAVAAGYGRNHPPKGLLHEAAARQRRES